MEATNAHVAAFVLGLKNRDQKFILHQIALALVHILPWSLLMVLDSKIIEIFAKKTKNTGFSLKYDCACPLVPEYN